MLHRRRCQMIAEITCPGLSAAIGGVIAGTIGFTVAWWKRWRDGRDQFLAVIAEIEADMDGRINALQQFHLSSLPPLRKAVFAVRPFVSDCRFEKIMKVWQAYKTPDSGQLDWALSMSRQAVHEAVSPNTPNPHVRADDWIRGRLNEFREAVG